MKFMVIEQFPDSGPGPAYERMASTGRGLPDGVRFVDSWVEVGLGRCFQLMEADSAEDLQKWVHHWTGLGIRVEVVPVVSGKDTGRLYEAGL
jgi:hypothetical protein